MVLVVVFVLVVMRRIEVQNTCGKANRGEEKKRSIRRGQAKSAKLPPRPLSEPTVCPQDGDLAEQQPSDKAGSSLQPAMP